MKKLLLILLLSSSASIASSNENSEFNKFVINSLSVKPNQNETYVIDLFGKQNQAKKSTDTSSFEGIKKIDYLLNFSSPENNPHHYMSIAIYKHKVIATLMCYEFMAAPGAFGEKCFPVQSFWQKCKSGNL